MTAVRSPIADDRDVDRDVDRVDDRTRDTDYPMRRWVFADAAGRFDIDLGDSHVQCGTLADLAVPEHLELDYGAEQGSPRLRELVAQRYGTSAESVLVTHGAQEALYLAYSVLLRPGDQVITFRPGWQQSWDAPAALGARVDALDLGTDVRGGFRVDVAAVAAAATERLRMIVVNTPGNPTGAAVAPADLAALGEIVARTGGHLLLDEEYAVDLTASASVGDDRVLSVSSLSKVYGLPGLRLGWLHAAPELVEACAGRKHLITIANSVLTERLAVDVLTRSESYLSRYRELTATGFSILREWCAGHADRLTLVPCHGTPFAWLWWHGAGSSLEFCRRVLDTGVLVMPAETVGGARGLRISFAREPDQLAEGLRRIDAVLDAVVDAATGAGP